MNPPDENFLLCNHQQTQFDSIYANSGLLIWHIDGSKWDLECASGLWRNICFETKVADPVSGDDTLSIFTPDHPDSMGCRNLGSKTDFFDGANKTEFSFREGSNPNTNSYEGTGSAQSMYTGIAVDSISPVYDTLGVNAIECFVTLPIHPSITLNSDTIIGCPGWDGDSLIVYVTVLDGGGEPVAGIPPDSIYAHFTKYCYNGGIAFADSSTNSLGKTTISMLQLGLGCSPDTLEVYVRGEKVPDCPQVLFFRTYDLAGDDCRITQEDSIAMASYYNEGDCCVNFDYDDTCGVADPDHAWPADVVELKLFQAHKRHPITVRWPNGGETWAAGAVQEVRWVVSDSTQTNSLVTLVLSGDGGSTFTDTIAKGVANDSSYTWSIPADAESLGTYRIKAIAYDNAGGNMAHSAADTSDVNFTITWGTPFCGTISSSTTWSGSVYVPCDVTVSSGDTLTILPGSVVRFAKSDSSHSGIDTGKCELIVQGTLIADGNQQSKPIFSSATSSSAAGDWRGIRLRPGSTSNLIDNCSIKYAYTGIEAESASVTVDSCTISNFSNDGIKAIASTVTLTRDSVLLGSTGTRGIELTSGTSGSVDHNTIKGSSSGTRYGIEIKDVATDPDLTYNWIDGPKHGIKVTDGYPLISHSRIKGSTGNAIQCNGEAGPEVRYTTLEDFQGTAVFAGDYTMLNLGSYPDSGSNRIYTGESFSYYVANLTEEPVPALYNWWGTSSPSSNKFYGDVDYLPCDASDPGTSYSLPLVPIASKTPESPYVSQSYPNPFNPKTTIEYGVSEPATRVRIIIYDIAGRALKQLVDKPHPSGRFSVSWDGKNEQGEVVASGVYFYEVRIGEFRQAKKLVVLK